MNNLAAQLLVIESSIALLPADCKVEVTIRLPVGTQAPEGYEHCDNADSATWYQKQIENDFGIVKKAILLRIPLD